MKIEKGDTIYYIVHAISVLDLELLTQILNPLADAVIDKVEVAQYLYDFERIFRKELDSEDTHFEVVHGWCEIKTSSEYNYTFIANYNRMNFTLKIEETVDGMILIKDCYDETNDKQIRFSSFKVKGIETPF